MSALFMAAQAGQVKAARVLLEHQADSELCDQQQCTPLIKASQKGHVQVVALLLGHGADIHREAQGWTALKLSEATGHEEVAVLLREHGAT